MADNAKTTDKSQKKSWFQGLQAEFKKIIWPDQNTLVKQTVAVVVVTLLVAIIISVLDSGILELINLLMK